MVDRKLTEKIFLSYASEDRHLVPRVEGELRKSGLLTERDVQLFDPDKDLRHTGDINIRDEIKERIQSSDSVVIILSEKMVQSPWVNYETGIADALDKPIYILNRSGEKANEYLSNIEDYKLIDIE